ncbi:hypothetical protein OOJ09_12675 [Mesorhizobium qingshengii]|uniref:Uncharacterized protein n=1 Tax=Mesorhizobium qingshengii TaxID=1165689 RepID=A0ABT4QTY0_9HYPH|nr:hypothetical protein [Mesorhizobium qingshengii]MCZ8545040.1 hypothetical protein [Mesorhizobium qingshengii]
MKIPAGAEKVEMVDGRVYYSTDNWHTVYLVKDGKARKLNGKEADLARFLAISQGS